MKSIAISWVLLLAGLTYWALSDRTLPSYPRTDYWVQSAQCAQTTGRYLLVCDPAKGEIPIEDVSLADDRGHTLILSVLADILKIEPSVGVLRGLNLILNFLGFALLTAVLVSNVGARSAIAIAVLGAYWIGARAGADVDAAYIGISALGASALILASTRKSYVSLVLIFLLLSFVSLIREPIGLGLSLSLFLLATTMLILNRHDLIKLIRPALLILIAFFALKAPSLPTKLRDATLGTMAVGTAAHGLSHNLFLGLGGFVENKWGIIWDDAYAAKLMKELHPTIEYCSDAYFKAIGQLYWSYVKEDPLEALRVYAVKTVRTFGAAEGLAWPALVSLILFVGLIVLFRRKSVRVPREDYQLALGPTLFGLSFIAQGILTHPAWTYIYPGPVLLMIAVALLSDSISRSTQKKKV